MCTQSKVSLCFHYLFVFLNETDRLNSVWSTENNQGGWVAHLNQQNTTRDHSSSVFFLLRFSAIEGGSIQHKKWGKKIIRINVIVA